MPEIQPSQNVFMVFYAIFWGAIFNVLPRWKAFNWPLVFSFKKTARRTALAFVLLNIIPVFYFWSVMRVLDIPLPAERPIAHLTFWGVVPAFAIIGIYRIWIGIVERWPDFFYAADNAEIPKPYRHVEPVYRQRQHSGDDFPIVDIAQGAGPWNLVAGLAYVLVSASALWWPI